MEKRKNKPFLINNELLPRIAKIRDLLEDKYPKCFVKHGQIPKPIKIGVKEEIYNSLKKQYPDIVSRKVLTAHLAMYTASEEYLKCILVDGAMRVDLDGNPVEPISDEHKEAAKSTPRKIKFFTNPVVEQKPTIKPSQAEVGKTKEEQDKPKRPVLSLKKKAS